MTMKELLGSFITHEHTMQMDRDKVEINKKKKKDLALRILMQEEDEDLDEGMTLLTTNFKMFLKKQESHHQGGKKMKRKGIKIKRDLKINEKKDNIKDKIQ